VKVTSAEEEETTDRISSNKRKYRKIVICSRIKQMSATTSQTIADIDEQRKLDDGRRLFETIYGRLALYVNRVLPHTHTHTHMFSLLISLSLSIFGINNLSVSITFRTIYLRNWPVSFFSSHFILTIHQTHLIDTCRSFVRFLLRKQLFISTIILTINPSSFYRNFPMLLYDIVNYRSWIWLLYFKIIKEI